MTRGLDPTGAVRARFARTGAAHVALFRDLEIGARKCDLGDESLYLAEELVAADPWLGGSDPETLAVAVLALLLVQRAGSTRLPLDPRGPLRAQVAAILGAAGREREVTRVVRAITALTTSPTFGSVIGAGDARAPLVVDDGCLYSERTRALEHRVALRLAERLAAPVSDPPSLGATPGLTDEQRAAVALALTGTIAIVTGGPGTGKTHVASAIVDALVARGVRDIALAAQTGKAANRLAEVVAQRARPDARVTAQTLHRLLGGRDGRFRHTARNPLPLGALIVDEASMLDLSLADGVLDALPATAPLVLIGDPDQLPAIDAGQVLADVIGGPRVVRLSQSFRMDARDVRGEAILRAAGAVRDGEGAKLAEPAAKLATTRTAGTLAFEGVEWVPTDRDGGSVRAVIDAFHHHHGGPDALRLADATVFRFDAGVIAPAQQHDLEALWRTLASARVLAVTRGQPTGAVAINAELHARALERMTVAGRPEYVPGEPVMITENDYERGLFNGDQGIVVRADEGLGRHHYRAVFRVGGRLAAFAIEALRDRLELAWALTVHKSQGSEFDAVCVVLPPEDLPLLTRELLYTAVTRARTSVIVAGGRRVLAAGAKRTGERYSGLATRIARELARRG